MVNILIYLTLIAYFGATALWLAFFLAQRENLCRAGAWLLGIGLVFHTLALIARTWAAGYLPVATMGQTLWSRPGPWWPRSSFFTGFSPLRSWGP